MEEGQVSADGVSRAAAASRSWSPRPRTRSSTKAPTRCPRPSSTGSCSRWSLPLPRARRGAADPAAARRRLRPARHRRRPACARSPAPADVEAAASAVRTRRGVARGARLRRRHRPGDPGLAVAEPRASARAAPPRCCARSRAWAWLQGRDFVTPDDVKALAGATLAHRLGLRPEAELEGVAVGQVLQGASTRCPCRDEPAPAGAPLLVLLGRASRSWCARPGHGGLVAARGAGCWWSWTCCSPRARARLARHPPAGRPGPAGRDRRTDLRGRQHRAPPGPRRAARRLAAVRRRDRQPAPRSTSPPATRCRLRTPLTPDPARRPARRPGHRALPGPLGLAARQASREVPGRGAGAAAVPLPQAPAQPAGPAPRARRPRRGPGPRPGHRVRLAARLRARRRRPQHRLAGQRPHAATSWSAPGSPSGTAGCCWSWTPRRTSAGRVDDVPRLDSAMDAALLLAALASRAGDSVDFLAGDRQVRARVRAAARRDAAAAGWSRRWPTWSRSWSRPTGRG